MESQSLNWMTCSWCLREWLVGGKGTTRLGGAASHRLVFEAAGWWIAPRAVEARVG
jgi:hypothetical protein